VEFDGDRALSKTRCDVRRIDEAVARNGQSVARSGVRPTIGDAKGRPRRCLKPDLFILEDRRLLTTYPVTSTLDDGSSGTLRWAVAQANAATSPSEVEFELGTSPATITLTQGQLELSNTANAITIADGMGQGPLTVSGNHAARVFLIDSQVTATITGLTIANGSANGNGGGIYNASGTTLDIQDCTIESCSATGMGGGLDSNGRATLTECTISGNTSNGYGGGIENSGYYSGQIAAMTLTNCRITGNYSSTGSGGLNNNGTVELTDCTLSGNNCDRAGSGMSTNNGWAVLTGCTISNNTASQSGGGFASWGGTAPSELTDSTISGNTTAGPGGALDDMSETVYLTNCTLSGNASQNGGGGVSIEGGATVDLTACTISSNTTPGQGGGIDNGGTATLTGTIVAGNSGGTGNDIDGLAVTGSYNLVGTDSVGLVNGQNGNIVGVTNPVLSTLGNYGGQTETMALLPGSPAIGAGTHVSGITSDQRGEPLDSPHPDIGAFQSQGFVFALVTGSTPQSMTDEFAFPHPLAVTIESNNSVEPVAGGVIAFAAPTSGASALLSPPNATVGSNGVASVTATANATAGSYTVTASAPGVGSLDFDLTNNLIPLGFTGPTDQSITYGTSSVIILGTLADGPLVPLGETVAVTLNGVRQSATINSIGAFSTSFNTSSLGVSGSPYTVNCVYTSDGNFASASTTCQLTVTRATPTVTWHNPAAIIYGTALGANQLDATASVPGTFTYTPSAGRVLKAGAGQTLSVSFTPTDTTDYTTAAANVTIDVSKATPSITWANPADITYGAALGSAQLDATASVPGSFAYTPTAGTVLPTGQGQTLTVSFTPTDAADYNGASATATINVLKATPTITWADPADITYGTALGPAHLDATASVPGTFAYTPAAGTILKAGSNQTLRASFTPSDTADYNGATAAVTINVAKTEPTITWANPFAITYGTALDPAQLDATAGVPGTFAYTPAAGTVLQAGTSQTLSVSFTPTDTADYSAASANVTIDVSRATPTMTWPHPAGIAYGTPLSSTQLDATASWAVGGTSQPVAGTFAYTPPAGTVLARGSNQTLSVAFTPADAVDYSPTTATTTINVGAVTPVITWPAPADITYGTALGPAQLDATANVPGTFTYSPAPGTVLHAGAGQTLSVTFVPQDSNDYTTATLTRSIDVDKATPKLAVSAPGGTFDGSPFPASVSIAGVGNTPAASLEETAPVLTYYLGAGTSGTRLGSTPPTQPGTYTVVASFPGTADYAPGQSAPATFTIGPGTSSIALTSSTVSAVFGQAVTLVATVTAAGGTPGGTVTFYDGATPLGTAPLDDSGRAALTTTTLVAGSHSISAAYGGDADFLRATSAPLAEPVRPATTQVALVPRPIFRKKKVTALGLVARVQPEDPGAGVPTGTATFEIAKRSHKKVVEKVLGTMALSGGSATLTVKPGKVLKKPITIVYGGDGDFTPSTATPPALTRKALKRLARPAVSPRADGE
jgi:hypothetical protein